MFLLFLQINVINIFYGLFCYGNSDGIPIEWSSSLVIILWGWLFVKYDPQSFYDGVKNIEMVFWATLFSRYFSSYNTPLADDISKKNSQVYCVLGENYWAKSALNQFIMKHEIYIGKQLNISSNIFWFSFTESIRLPEHMQWVEWL